MRCSVSRGLRLLGATSAHAATTILSPGGHAEKLVETRPQPQPQNLESIIFRSLGNGVRKNGVRNRCPYRRCGVDTEIQYRLLSLILCGVESLEAELLVGFGGIEAIDTEFPYRVPIVDRGAIAVPLFADPISDS